jgi:hypothetical protein
MDARSIAHRMRCKQKPMNGVAALGRLCLQGLRLCVHTCRIAAHLYHVGQAIGECQRSHLCCETAMRSTCFEFPLPIRPLDRRVNALS